MTDDERTDGPTVLIVEDEADLANLYATWLEGVCDVRVAHDRATGRELLDVAVDVALLDRQLPDGSGDDLLAAARAADLDCGVAAVTAVDPGPDGEAPRYDEYVQKPVSADELRALVDRLHAHTSDGGTNARGPSAPESPKNADANCREVESE